MSYIIALDLETTGLDSQKDTIIEVALIKIDTNTFEVVDVYNTFINPEIPIPQLISEITHISDDMVAEAPVFKEVRQTITDFIGNTPILGHNTTFDRDFLLSHGIAIDHNLVLDTFYLANFLLRDIKSLSLEYICGHLGSPLQGAHRALNDTHATVFVYNKLIEQLKDTPPEKLSLFWYIAKKSENKMWYFIKENYLEIQEISIESFEKSILQQIQNNTAPEQEKKENSFETSSIDASFSALGDIEVRENQKRMAHIVEETFNAGKKSLIEAPTGLGKTFAYLIPSIHFSLRMQEQVFISTSTKALQDQIYYKDLASLSDAFQGVFTYTKLKGKKNYLGVYNFFHFLYGENMYTINQSSFLLKIIFWLGDTLDGELDSLDFYGEEYTFLQYINAASSFSLSDQNPYREFEYIIRAREKAQKSDIVVINNHILFQDIFSEGRILGEVQNLVIDEAHILEDVVTQSLKKKIHSEALENSFLEIESNLREEKDFDIQPFLLKKEQFLFEIHTVLDFAYQYLFSRIQKDNKYKILLLKDDFLTENPSLFQTGEKLEFIYKEILQTLLGISEINTLKNSVYIGAIQETLEIWKSFLDTEKRATFIYILNYHDIYGLSLERTVLNPGSFLEQNLWNKLGSCILTSATLKIGESFTYIEDMLSLSSFESFSLETDFDYSKQALILIPSDLGSIKNNLPQVISFFSDFFATVGGKTLVLFTSFMVIREVYVQLATPLAQKGTTIMAQSVSGSKQKQIEYFKENSENSILLGTDSFWEGIDIPGEDLKYLIVHKIPFMVPTDPIFLARSALYKNSFQEYAIPKSILKLKQGFGRLIRSKTDSGIFVFMDDRITTTRWGEEFLKSFPKDITIKKCSSEKILQVLKK